MYLLSILITLVLYIPGGAHAQGIVINEVMSANSNSIADEDGSHSDWIELYNPGPGPVDLLGYGITDKPSEPFKWVFPSRTIASGGYLLVFASDKNRKTGPYLHTNFSIKADGESLALTKPDATRVDYLAAVAIPTDVSFGRQPDGQAGWLFFAEPTPGAANTTEGYQGALAQPVFSRSRGFYTTGFDLTLTTNVEGATIRYTTDGSDPTEASVAFTTPIPVSSKVGVPNDISMISTTSYSGTPWMPPVGEVFKTTVVRAKTFRSGFMPSPTATHTYLVDPSATTRYSLPVVSLATDRKNFFDPETGIYVEGTNHPPGEPYLANYDQDWERPINVEFFEPGGVCGFACQAGVKIHGSWTTRYPQKSLRLYADDMGGPGSFNYRVFPDSPMTDYKRLILRNGGQDFNQAFLRDEMMQSLVKGTDLDVQNYRPAIVFLNGEFWGIHDIREREDKYYVAAHHGADPDNIDMLAQGWMEVKEGDRNHFVALTDFMRNNNLALQSNYDYVKTQMYVDNFITYQVAEIYFGNTDWPNNNSLYWRPKTTGGKWRWALQDLDLAFGVMHGAAKWTGSPVSHDTLAFATARGGTDHPNPDLSTLHLRSLLKNKEFRNSFINRMADMLNSYFVPDVVVQKINDMQAAKAPAMAEHIARWRRPGSIGEWNSYVQVLRDFAAARPAQVRGHFVKYFGLGGTVSVTASVSSPAMGDVTVNTVQIPNNAYPWHGVYFQDVPISVTAVPKQGFHFVRWDGIPTGSGNPVTITPAADVTITAVFEVDQ
jgi:hypothetical protein